MKTLKISVIATIAAALAWWIRVPHRFWPAHPRFASLLLGLIICIVLQFTWPDSEPERKSQKS
jgi:hypothetical protein